MQNFQIGGIAQLNYICGILYARSGIGELFKNKFRFSLLNKEGLQNFYKYKT